MAHLHPRCSFEEPHGAFCACRHLTAPLQTGPLSPAVQPLQAGHVGSAKGSSSPCPPRQATLGWPGEQRPGPEPPSVCPAGAEPSPALLVPSAKRRSRKTSKDTGDSKDGGTLGTEEPGAKARGRGRKPSTKAKSGMSAPARTWPRPRGRCGSWGAQATCLCGDLVLGVLGPCDRLGDRGPGRHVGLLGAEWRFSQVVHSSIRGQGLEPRPLGTTLGSPPIG